MDLTYQVHTGSYSDNHSSQKLNSIDGCPLSSISDWRELEQVTWKLVPGIRPSNPFASSRPWPIIATVLSLTVISEYSLRIRVPALSAQARPYEVNRTRLVMSIRIWSLEVRDCRHHGVSFRSATLFAKQRDILLPILGIGRHEITETLWVSKTHDCDGISQQPKRQVVDMPDGS